MRVMVASTYPFFFLLLLVVGSFFFINRILSNRGRTSIAVGACMVYQPELKKGKRKSKPAIPKVCFCSFLFSFCMTMSIVTHFILFLW